MAIREIIRIDEEKCNGCGECVPSCAEGAIQIINGKAKLVNDRFCDGLGACLGNCPTGAITVERREAEDFDEAAVEAHLARLGDAKANPEAQQGKQEAKMAGRHQEPKASHRLRTLAVLNQDDPHRGSEPSSPPVCPGSLMRRLQAQTAGEPRPNAGDGAAPGVAPGAPTFAGPGGQESAMPPSSLGHWPVQLALVPPQAPFLEGADLLICADCVPFVVPDFHARYLAGRAVLVGCPKLDDLQAYYQKFRQIFTAARPAKITVLRLEVPCCGGIAQAAIQAHQECAPDIPLAVHTLGIRGGLVQTTEPRA